MPTSVGSSKKQENSRKTSISAFIDYVKVLDCVDHKKLWKMVQEMKIAVDLTCLLRNLYTDQEATVRTRHGITNWFQTGKAVKAVYCHPAYLVYAEYIIGNTRLNEAQARNRLQGEIPITSDMEMTPPDDKK